VLDATDGSLLAQRVLTAFSGIYEIRQPLAGPDIFLVSAGQGQDPAMSYVVSYLDGTLQVLPVGAEDEPITGVDARGAAILKIERGGACITAYALTESRETQQQSRVDSTALAGEDSEDRIVGRPGFVDEATVLAAVAEEEWGKEARHFLLDAATLQVSAELEYHVPIGPDPLPLADGTWLTTSGDEVYRWSAEGAAN
jgi:hypothetical protein